MQGIFYKEKIVTLPPILNKAAKINPINSLDQDAYNDFVKSEGRNDTFGS